MSEAEWRRYECAVQWHVARRDEKFVIFLRGLLPARRWRWVGDRKLRLEVVELYAPGPR